MYRNYFGDIKCALGIILVFCCVIKFGNGCFNSGWEFLFEDVIADICPALTSTTLKVKDLFKLPLIGKFIDLESKY